MEKYKAFLFHNAEVDFTQAVEGLTREDFSENLKKFAKNSALLQTAQNGVDATTKQMPSPTENVKMEQIEETRCAEISSPEAEREL